MQEAVEVAGDVDWLEVEVQVLLVAGWEWLGWREGNNFVGRHAGNRDQEGAVDFACVHFAVEFIEAVSSQSGGRGAD